MAICSFASLGDTLVLAVQCSSHMAFFGLIQLQTITDDKS
jgi:hypothetical protein